MASTSKNQYPRDTRVCTVRRTLSLKTLAQLGEDLAGGNRHARRRAKTMFRRNAKRIKREERERGE